jgi:hypothetical protein
VNYRGNCYESRRVTRKELQTLIPTYVMCKFLHRKKGTYVIVPTRREIKIYIYIYYIFYDIITISHQTDDMKIM